MTIVQLIFLAGISVVLIMLAGRRTAGQHSKDSWRCSFCDWLARRWGFPSGEARSKHLNAWDFEQANDWEIIQRDPLKDQVREAIRLLSTAPEEAFETLLALAEAGSVWSMVQLAWCYQAGKGTVRDLVKAEDRYRRAFEAGSEHALLRYGGFCWWKGDLGRCEAVYGVGAAKGLAPAQYWLARTRFRKSRSRATLRQVRPLLDSAVGKGSAAAAMFLGSYISRGWFGLREVPSGFRLFVQASSKTTAEIEAKNPASEAPRPAPKPSSAMRLFGRFLASPLRALASRVDNLPSIRAKTAWKAGDYLTARSLLLPLAKAGNRDAQDRLGRLYYFALGVPRDFSEAVKWWQIAAERGHRRSQTSLGAVYERGEGVPANTKTAIDWYRRAAAKGDPAAPGYLGRAYEVGDELPKDHGAAVKWYRTAAARGDALGQYNLGRMLSRGWGVQRDAVQARRWLRKAADQGEAHAQCALGYAYAHDDGILRDDARAVGLFNASVVQGNPEAMLSLGWMYANGRGVAYDPMQAYVWNSLALIHLPGDDAASRETAGSWKKWAASYLTKAQIAKGRRLVKKWVSTPN